MAAFIIHIIIGKVILFGTKEQSFVVVEFDQCSKVKEVRGQIIESDLMQNI
jgi:hypothetical protein